MAGNAYAPIFTSLDNFRDVGGSPTVDGRHVRTGRLYRSDTLTKLSADEAADFASLGIRTVIDLRRPTEVEEFGRIADAVDRRYINISPEHATWDGTAYDDIAGPARFLADRYHDLACDGVAGIGEVIAMLAEASAEPTVVHCLAGKAEPASSSRWRSPRSVSGWMPSPTTMRCPTRGRSGSPRTASNHTGYQRHARR